LENNRILSALCYFSVLFAPFLLPIIVYFITQEKEVKYHAKRSIISHLIPVGLGIIGFLVLMVGSVAMYSNPLEIESSPSFGFFTAGGSLLFMGIYAILSLAVLIWNIIQGVKVLR